MKGGVKQPSNAVVRTCVCVATSHSPSQQLIHADITTDQLCSSLETKLITARESTSELAENLSFRWMNGQRSTSITSDTLVKLAATQLCWRTITCHQQHRPQTKTLTDTQTQTPHRPHTDLTDTDFTHTHTHTDLTHRQTGTLWTSVGDYITRSYLIIISCNVWQWTSTMD